MPPPSPLLDEHGFPIPPTFDGPAAPRRPSGFLRRAWRLALVLAFLGLVAGSVYRSALAGGVKDWIAEQLVDRAGHKCQQGDFSGALDDLEWAASWSPDAPDIFELRARLKLETNDVAGSLKDYDRLIRLAPRHAPAYLGRSVVYQRLQRHREAIDDLTKAINLSPSRAATPRNNRAYARAIAGVELDAALTDVEQAIRIVDQEIAEIEQTYGDSPRIKPYIVRLNAQKAAYLDTRGYIYFLQDNNISAHEDLSRAIDLCLDWQSLQMSAATPSQKGLLQQQFNRELSVMYHHRGQVLAKLGREQEAQSDLDRGDKLGYNPAEGVF